MRRAGEKVKEMKLVNKFKLNDISEMIKINEVKGSETNQWI